MSSERRRGRDSAVRLPRQSVSPYPRPRKRFGQHFLEPAWVSKLIDAVAPGSDDTFLEIGPGRGALTGTLASMVARLVCVEIDRDLAASLTATLSPRVEVVEADFLDVDVGALLRHADRRHGVLPARVIGNLPYNISSPILFKLLESADDGRLLSDATLMLQKEVADRITAAPGSKAYGTLAVQVGRLADVATLFTLPPGAFRPAPRVTSAVVRLRFRPSSVDAGDAATFSRIVRGVFLHRRKTMLNALDSVAASVGLPASEMLARSGVDPRKRPEELTVAEFARLSRAVL